MELAAVFETLFCPPDTNLTGTENPKSLHLAKLCGPLFSKLDALHHDCVFNNLYSFMKEEEWQQLTIHKKGQENLSRVGANL
jgi:hypothetical protein